MKRILRGLAAAVLGALLCLPALAVLPATGTWAFSGELDGKPGRSLQIDRQGGKTLIVSYLGYRADGSSMFLQSIGTLKDGRHFTADLVEFRNGPALGGTVRNGEAARNAGPVAITFDSTTTGTITLPGEPARRIARFQYEDLTPRLNFAFAASTISRSAAVGPSGMLRLSAANHTLQMREALQTLSGSHVCEYQGDLVPAGRGFRSQGSVTCDFAEGPTTYRLEDLVVDEYGMLSGRLYWSSSGVLRSIVGVCQAETFIGIDTRCYPSELGFTPEDWDE